MNSIFIANTFIKQVKDNFLKVPSRAHNPPPSPSFTLNESKLGVGYFLVYLCFRVGYFGYGVAQERIGTSGVKKTTSALF